MAHSYKLVVSIMNFSAWVELKRQTLKIFYPEYGDMRMMSLGFVENAMQFFLLKYKISNIMRSLFLS